jgi:hypothetical protein
MTDIKQEWIKAAEDAHYEGARSVNPSISIEAYILEAVAPLIRADALREAAGECRTVMNTIGREMKDANPGPQITATYKIDGILIAERAITALIDTPPAKKGSNEQPKDA